MKVIDVKLSKFESHNELASYFRNKRLKRGDTVKVSDSNLILVGVTAVVVALVVYFLHKKNKPSDVNNDSDHGDNVIKSLFSPNLTSEELEQEIEKEFGIYIEYGEDGQPNDVRENRKFKKYTELQNKLLKGPVMSDQHYQEYIENRKNFNEWPKA